MVQLSKIALVLFLPIFLSCKTDNTRPLIVKDETNENERNNTLFVFVGEKLEFTEVPANENSIDNKFRAKYKIEQRVYGNYSSDTIEFEIYDHRGIPAFSKYKNVLLFLSESNGKYYHEKYQYNDVYKTKDGRWAGSYSISDYEHEYNKNTVIKPEKIEFAEDVFYPTKIKLENGKEESVSYPQPYYKIIGDRAIAIYGNYIEDLFILKKEGVLTARELFGNKTYTPPQAEPITGVRIVDIKNKELSSFWKSLSLVIKKSDKIEFRKIALDSIMVCDSVISLDKFMTNCYNKIFDSTLLTKINSSSNIGYTGSTGKVPFSPAFIKAEAIKIGPVFNSYDIQILKNTDYNIATNVYLLFFKTTHGYRFYGYENYSSEKCCIY